MKNWNKIYDLLRSSDDELRLLGATIALNQGEECLKHLPDTAWKPDNPFYRKMPVDLDSMIYHKNGISIYVNKLSLVCRKSKCLIYWKGIKTIEV